MAYELAKAYVQVVPTTQNITKQLTEEIVPGADSAAETAGKSSGKKFGSFFSSAAKTTLKAMGVITAAAAAGMAALTKSAVSAYADYEQLVGGVETLFKDSADVVQEYAANAYQTAGLSANEYMETVTSFSASLIQSLGGDTAAAAEKANQALTDMSDNANKMGTDMVSIQNAYSGFAKQNYTMLDNLKLGYGGTKEEMQRLLDTANELNAAQGKYTEYSIDSYADVVDAIHVVQTEMGITGTTALEATETISGSIGMLSGAWSNLIAGLGDDEADISDLCNKVIDSADEVLDNVLPVIENIVDAVPNAIIKLTKSLQKSGILKKVLGAVTDIFDSVVDMLPDFLTDVIETLGGMLPSVMASIGNMVGKIASNFGTILRPLITSLLSFMKDQLPTLLTTVISGLGELAGGIIEVLPDVLSGIFEALPNIVSGLLKGIQGSLESVTHSIFKNIVKAWTGVNIDEEKEMVEAAALEITAAISSAQARLEAIESQAPNVADLLADTGRTASEIESNIKDVEATITQIISSAIQENGALYEEDLQQIQDYLNQLDELWGEKLGIYGNYVNAQLDLLKYGENLSYEESAQIVANIKDYCSQAKETIEQAKAEELAILQNTFNAEETMTAAEYQAQINAINEKYDTMLSTYDAAYREATQYSADIAAVTSTSIVDSFAQANTAISEAKGTLTDSADGMVKLAYATSKAQGGFVGFITDAIDVVFNGKKVSDCVDEITTAAIGNHDYIQNEWVPAFEAIDTEMANTINAMFDAADATVHAGGEIDTETRNSLATVLEFFRNVPAEYEDAGKEVMLGLIKGMDGVDIDAAATMTTSELVDTVKKELDINSPSGVFEGIGRNTIVGFCNGADNQKSSLFSKFRSIANSVISTTKSILGIRSPSRVFAEIGGYTMEGYAEGITDNTDMVLDAAENATAGVIDAFSTVKADMSDVTMSVTGTVPELSGAMTATADYTETVSLTDGTKMDILIALLRKYLPGLADADVYLDGDVLVGGIADRMNTALGSIALRTARGTV